MDTTTNQNGQDAEIADVKVEVKAETGKDLRTRFEAQLAKEKAEKKELKDKLDQIEKAEIDKNKSLEEKLAEKDSEILKIHKEARQSQTISQIEKELLKNNVDSEFQDLLLSKASLESDKEDFDLATTIENLKSQYPKAFAITNEEPKPIGKVGVSISTSSSPQKLTREKAIELLNSKFNSKYKQYTEKELYEAIK